MGRREGRLPKMEGGLRAFPHVTLAAAVPGRLAGRVRKSPVTRAAAAAADARYRADKAGVHSQKGSKTVHSAAAGRTAAAVIPRKTAATACRTGRDKPPGRTRAGGRIPKAVYRKKRRSARALPRRRVSSSR